MTSNFNNVKNYFFNIYSKTKVSKNKLDKCMKYLKDTDNLENSLLFVRNNLNENDENMLMTFLLLEVLKEEKINFDIAYLLYIWIKKKKISQINFMIRLFSSYFCINSDKLIKDTFYDYRKLNDFSISLPFLYSLFKKKSYLFPTYLKTHLERRMKSLETQKYNYKESLSEIRFYIRSKCYRETIAFTYNIGYKYEYMSNYDIILNNICDYVQNYNDEQSITIGLLYDLAIIFINDKKPLIGDYIHNKKMKEYIRKKKLSNK